MPDTGNEESSKTMNPTNTWKATATNRRTPDTNQCPDHPPPREGGYTKGARCATCNKLL